jgi:hypothetical protein
MVLCGNSVSQTQKTKLKLCLRLLSRVQQKNQESNSFGQVW